MTTLMVPAKPVGVKLVPVHDVVFKLAQVRFTEDPAATEAWLATIIAAGLLPVVPLPVEFDTAVR